MALVFQTVLTAIQEVDQAIACLQVTCEGIRLTIFQHRMGNRGQIQCLLANSTFLNSNREQISHISPAANNTNYYNQIQMARYTIQII